MILNEHNAELDFLPQPAAQGHDPRLIVMAPPVSGALYSISRNFKKFQEFSSMFNNFQEISRNFKEFQGDQFGCIRIEILGVHGR